MSKKLIEKTLRRFDELKSLRVNWESHWQEVADYTTPRMGGFTTRNTAGIKLNTKLTDSTAIRSAQILAAGLHGHLTSPATPWFTLRTEDTSLHNNPAIASWLKEVEKAMYSVFNTKSNWNHQIHEGYMEMVNFGTVVIYIEADKGKIVRFDTRPLSECYLAEDAYGEVDTVYRDFMMAVRQVEQRFGEGRMSDQAKKILRDKPDTKIAILHAVQPRHTRDPGKKGATNMPWASIYMERDHKKMLRHSGYKQFPYAVARWTKAPSEEYGRSPAMDALPDTKMVNAISKVLIRASQKAVDPPLQIPHNGFIAPLKASPGGINITRLDLDKGGVKPLPHNANIPVGLEILDRYKESIKEAFFVNLFLMLEDRPQMTATEVMERVEEKMIVLGPSLGRLQSELLNPVIDRVFRLMGDQGELPKLPEGVDENLSYAVDYVSPLARAQKFQSVLVVQRALQHVGEVAQFDPMVIQMINTPQIIRDLWDAMGISPTTLKTDEEYAQAVLAIKQQQQQQQQLAAGQVQGETIAKVLKALPEEEQKALIAEIKEGAAE